MSDDLVDLRRYVDRLADVVDERAEGRVAVMPGGEPPSGARRRVAVVAALVAVVLVAGAVGTQLARSTQPVTVGGSVPAEPSTKGSTTSAQPATTGTVADTTTATTRRPPARLPGTTVAPDRGRASGALLSGRAWTVVERPGHGLCVTIAELDLGCDEIGPVVPPDADPATPRLAIDPVAMEQAGPSAPHPESLGVVLVYAYLVPGSTAVRLIGLDGSPLPSEATVDAGGLLWAVPVDPAHLPVRVEYLRGTTVHRSIDVP